MKNERHMITDQFEKFWNWLLLELDKENMQETKDWMEEKFYQYLAKERPTGWKKYYYELQERGHIVNEVVKP